MSAVHASPCPTAEPQTAPKPVGAAVTAARSALVPAGASAVRICPYVAGHLTGATLVDSPEDVLRLTVALDRYVIRTEPVYAFCQTAVSTITFLATFSYGDREPVQVKALLWCNYLATNGILVATPRVPEDGYHLADLIEELTGVR